MEIPDSVTSIGDEAFYGCSSLDAAAFPESLESIGLKAFYGCDSLRSVIIPENVTAIGTNAFKNCTNLASVAVSEGNPSYCDISGVLFNKNATKLLCYPQGRYGDFEIPDTITSIDYEAFHNCTHLTEITIPDSVTVIAENAFNDCDSLTCGSIAEVAALYTKRSTCGLEDC